MIFNKSCTISICIIIFFSVLTQNYELNVPTNVRIYYSYSTHNSDLKYFKLIAGVSIKECKNRCEQRLVCKALVYRRPPLVCFLFSTISEESIEKQNGTILITRFDGNSRTNHTNETETITTECEKLQGNYDVYGNMNDVGSTIMVDGKSNGKDLLLTCNATGNWTPRKKDLSNSVTTVSLAGDCSDVTGQSGLYWVPKTKSPVFCYMETASGDWLAASGGWLVFQRREDGSVDFNRNWANYTTGFGNVGGEFWMGLLPLYELMNVHEYELRIEMVAFDDTKGYASYDKFVIGAPEVNFKLYVNGYTGNVGNSLIQHKGSPFSTFDKDNDVWDDGSCAGHFSAGWWFSKCYYSNLNGKYVYCRSKCPFSHNIAWHTWTGLNHTIQRTEMKIRRRG